MRELRERLGIFESSGESESHHQQLRVKQSEDFHSWRRYIAGLGYIYLTWVAFLELPFTNLREVTSRSRHIPKFPFIK